MGSKFRSLVFFLAAVTILENFCYNGLRISKFSLSPHIWFSGYKQIGSDEIEKSDSGFQHSPEVSSEDVYKNGSVYTILSSSNMWAAYFTCEAFYPIRWNIPHPQQFSRIGSYVFTMFGDRSSYFNDELHKPVNKKYSLTLEISSSSLIFFAGNITCESFKNEAKHSSIYLFIEGEQVIQNQHETIFVNVTPSAPAKTKKLHSKHVLLPCRPGLPNIGIDLFKKVQKGEAKDSPEWILLPLNSSVSFDPAFGFTLTFDDASTSNIFGTYKCQLVQDEDVFVTVVVKAGVELEPVKFELKLKQVFKSQSANLTHERGRIECCTGNPDHALESNSISCYNENHCEIQKTMFAYDLAVGKEVLYVIDGGNETNCHIADMVFTSEVLVCRSPELDVVAQYIRVYDNDQQKEKKLAQKQSNNYACSPFVWPAEHTHLYAVSGKDPTIEEKMMILFATPLSGDHYKGLPYSSVEYFLHSPDYEFLYVNDATYQPDRKVKYLTYHSGEISAKVSLSFATAYRIFTPEGVGFDSTGKMEQKLYFKVYWHTNSEESQVAYMGSVRETDNTIIANLTIADMSMDSVDCFVPQWNTDKWDLRQFKLNITPPVPPKLWNEEEVEEILLDKQGSSRNGKDEMTCTLTQGKPVPVIVWEKDGVIIKDWKIISLLGGQASNFGNATSNTVRFWNITEDLIGTYTCIAKNLAGKTEKTFQLRIWEYGDVLQGARTQRIVLVTLTCAVGVTSLAVIILFKMKRLHFRNLLRF